MTWVYVNAEYDGRIMVVDHDNVVLKTRPIPPDFLAASLIRMLIHHFHHNHLIRL